MRWFDYDTKRSDREIANHKRRIEFSGCQFDVPRDDVILPGRSLNQRHAAKTTERLN